MKKLALPLKVALVALQIGVASFAFGITPSSEEIPKLQVKTNIPNGWRKIDERKFSLYLPADMESCSEEPVGCVDGSWEGANRFCSSAGLVVAYTWFKHRKDEKSCFQLPALEHENYQTSEIKVVGKWSRLHIWNNPAREFGSARTALCFDDIGDGKTGLSISVANSDKGALNLASQIFDSIEFR